MALGRKFLLLAALAGLCACAEVKITENTVQAVTVHYYGLVPPSPDDAAEAARKACATHGKIAHLRRVDEIATSDHYAHFDCVGG